MKIVRIFSLSSILYNWKLHPAQVRDHIHRSEEHCHGDILAHTEYGMIGEIIHYDSDDRPGQLQNSWDMHRCSLEPSIIDIHRNKTSGTGDDDEVEPLDMGWNPEALIPTWYHEESCADDNSRQSEPEHRDDLWMMILQKIFGEIGRAPPGRCSPEGTHSGKYLFLPIRRPGYSTWESDEVPSDKCERDEKEGELRNFLFPDDESHSDREDGLELLNKYSDTERDESDCSKCHGEEERPYHSWKKWDDEYRTSFPRSQVDLLIGTEREWSDEEESEDMLEKYKGWRWKSIEGTSEKPIECPESCCDDDKYRSKWFHIVFLE